MTTQEPPEEHVPPKLATWHPSQLQSWLWAPVVAIQFLTRIPIRGVPDWAYEDETRGKSFAFYPAVGVIVGAFGGLTALVASRLHLPSMACAILAVVSTATVTGALHEDGLADVADGLGPHNREDALKAMRDSRIGSFGTIALWALLTLKVVAISSLHDWSLCKAIIAAHVLSRWSSLPLSIALPYAQSTAGLGAKMAAALNVKFVVIASVITAALVLSTLNPIVAVRSGVVASIITFVTGLFYRKKFGGVTGDCLGATNQLVEVAVLFVAAM